METDDITFVTEEVESGYHGYAETPGGVDVGGAPPAGASPSSGAGEEEVHRKRRPRGHGDPDRKGKRPRPAYLHYYTEAHARVRRQHPELPRSEINRRVSEGWRRLAVGERDVYLQRAHAERARASTPATTGGALSMSTAPSPEPPTSSPLPGFRRILPRSVYLVIPAAGGKGGWRGGPGDSGRGGAVAGGQVPAWEEAAVGAVVEADAATQSAVQSVLVSPPGSGSERGLGATPSSTAEGPPRRPERGLEVVVMETLPPPPPPHDWGGTEGAVAPVHVPGFAGTHSAPPVEESRAQFILVPVSNATQDGHTPGKATGKSTYTRRGRGSCPGAGCCFGYVTRHKPPVCPHCGTWLGGKWVPRAGAVARGAPAAAAAAAAAAAPPAAKGGGGGGGGKGGVDLAVAKRLCLGSLPVTAVFDVSIQLHGAEASSVGGEPLPGPPTPAGSAEPNQAVAGLMVATATGPEGAAQPRGPPCRAGAAAKDAVSPSPPPDGMSNGKDPGAPASRSPILPAAVHAGKGSAEVARVPPVLPSGPRVSPAGGVRVGLRPIAKEPSARNPRRHFTASSPRPVQLIAGTPPVRGMFDNFAIQLPLGASGPGRTVALQPAPPPALPPPTPFCGPVGPVQRVSPRPLRAILPAVATAVPAATPAPVPTAAPGPAATSSAPPAAAAAAAGVAAGVAFVQFIAVPGPRCSAEGGVLVAGGGGGGGGGRPGETPPTAGGSAPLAATLVSLPQQQQQQQQIAAALAVQPAPPQAGLKASTLKQLGQAGTGGEGAQVEEGNFGTLVQAHHRLHHPFELGLATSRGKGHCKSPGCGFVYMNRHKPLACPKCGAALRSQSRRALRSQAQPCYDEVLEAVARADEAALADDAEPAGDEEDRGDAVAVTMMMTAEGAGEEGAPEAGEAAAGPGARPLADPGRPLTAQQRVVQRRSTVALLRRSLHIPESEAELAPALARVALRDAATSRAEASSCTVEEGKEAGEEGRWGGRRWRRRRWRRWCCWRRRGGGLVLHRAGGEGPGWALGYGPSAHLCQLCGTWLSSVDRSMLGLDEDCWLLSSCHLLRVSAVVKMCLEPSCLALHGFCDINSGLFNVGNRLLVTLDLLLHIRQRVRDGDNPSDTAREIVHAAGGGFGRGGPPGAERPPPAALSELLAAGYWAFESLTARDYNDMICGVCGVAPRLELAQRGAHGLLDLDDLELVWPGEEGEANEVGGEEVSADDFWSLMETEALEAAAFPGAAAPRLEAAAVAPFIPPLMRGALTINTERDKVERGPASGCAESLMRLVLAGELDVATLHSSPRERLEDACQRCGLPCSATLSREELCVSLVCLYASVLDGGRPPGSETLARPSHTGGKIYKMCPHQVISASKYLVRAERARDHVDLLVSCLHWPPVYVSDLARDVALNVEARYPALAAQLWGLTQGCFSDPFAPPQLVSCPELQEQCFAEDDPSPEGSLVHPVTRSTRRWVAQAPPPTATTAGDAGDGDGDGGGDGDPGGHRPHRSLSACRELEPYDAALAGLDASPASARRRSRPARFSSAPHYFLFSRLCDFLTSRDVVAHQIGALLAACQPGQVLIRDSLYRLGVAQLEGDVDEGGEEEEAAEEGADDVRGEGGGDDAGAADAATDGHGEAAAAAPNGAAGEVATVVGGGGAGGGGVGGDIAAGAGDGGGGGGGGAG
uniref:LOW QUALITY PROTEIN: HMG domain-containing protein 3 n=1 Tax=Petromyzon marinus TaxID=7757 RepID=A0AAJ7UAU7_PETMA|nr:LOW QUALITY PROTEIN: HMG domain-containing protein 3 [Petromyzon marinus]